MLKRYEAVLGLMLGAVFLAVPVAAGATPFTVSITNLSPTNGTYLTPFWVGFHDGSFDIYDTGSAASSSLEHLAEDGNASFISSDFASASGTSQDSVIAGPGGAYAPGDMSSMTFDLNPNDPNSRYFSFAAMVIPSNDAFVSNDDPLAYQLFDMSGNFTPVSFILLGSQVLDAGTEVNDELPMNTAFFGQAAPNTGVDQNGVVAPHPGFLPVGSGGILDDARFVAANFLAQGYQVAQISITRAVPEPAALALFLTGLLGLGAMAASRRRHLV